MPNYLYKCTECDDIMDIILPISSDPKQLLLSPGHQVHCKGAYTRIMRPFNSIKGLRTFAGDWFKKTYGHDIAKPYEDASRQKEDFETMKRELEKDK